MSSAPFRLTPLDAAHVRAAFNCGSEPLERYLREQVTQDVRRRVAACFVALAEGQRIAGYYTLASASLLLADLPASVGKKLPRYPTVPAVRMGRLAVDQAFKGQGLGGALVAACGVLVSMFLPFSASMGVAFTMKALVIVIMGGVGNLLGCLLQNILVGINLIVFPL